MSAGWREGQGLASPSNPACPADIELGDQLAGDQGRRRDGSADLVRVLPLRDRSLLPLRVCRRAARGLPSAAIGLAAGRGFRGAPDGRVFRPDRSRFDHPSAGTSFRAGLFDADLGRPARGLVAARACVANGFVRSWDLGCWACWRSRLPLSIPTEQNRSSPMPCFWGPPAAWAISIVAVRAHRFTATALALAPWQMLVAACLLLPLAIVVEGAPRPIGVSGAASLAYVGPIATAFAYWAVVEAGRHIRRSTYVDGASWRLPASAS